MKTISVKGLSDLPDAAEELLEQIGDRRVVALYGEMGAGKTTLIKELCRCKGVVETVNSPTFAIVNVYNTEEGEPVYHFDFYRIEKLEEAYDFGFDEYFDSGNLCLIEWPEKIEELLPEDTLRVRINITGDNDRQIEVAD